MCIKNFSGKTQELRTVNLYLYLSVKNVPIALKQGKKLKKAFKYKRVVIIILASMSELFRWITYRTLGLKYLELYFDGIFDISTDNFMPCDCNKRV